MSFDPFPEEYLRQLEAKYGERRKSEFKKESPTVLKYFIAVSKKLAETYTIEKILAVGGTGIVHTGHHNRFRQAIALKFNRPNIEPEGESMVEHEANTLPTLNHPNIIQVLDLDTLPDHQPKLTYIIEPFITGSMPFLISDRSRIHEGWLHKELEDLRHHMPDPPEPGYGDNADEAISLVKVLLAKVADLFSQWVSLLAHVHLSHAKAENGYIYLDVKPENVLIDEHLHLTSIDYGSLEHIDRDDQTPIDVFYTERYAHPRLIERKKDKASSNRVRGGLKRSELRHEFDYYALGMSMLEILNAIAGIRPHVLPQLPLYRSLHFLATRLLDGQNSNPQAEDPEDYAKQVFPGLEASDYANLGYHTLNDAYRDLEKERGRWNLEAQTPELATYSKDIVRLVPGYNTVLTSRLRGVIEHPLVARLKCLTQLGLVSLVYPTADHSRYDHALGSYTYTTYYIKSLFNDLGSPIFRNLVAAEDINSVLLAALLHDLGQYPLAHDLEEVHERIFKHGLIGMDLLEDPMLDRHGRTLKEIIEDPQNGWGVSIQALRRILGAHSTNVDLFEEDQTITFKTNVLTAIVDGQIDADKADYIIRDSVRCELPYGFQLDLERLLRVLTVAILPKKELEPQRRVTLGVYDKGLVSAHAFGQARYQLLSTVYWHHTTRIIKAMLQYATASGLPIEVFGADSQERDRIEQEIRERLLVFIKSLLPPFDFPPEQVYPSPLKQKVDLTAPPLEKVIASIENDAPAKGEAGEEIISTNSWYPGIAWTDWLMLKWISNLPKSKRMSRNLIYGIQTRRLYKRIATLPRDGSYSDIIEELDKLHWSGRVSLCQKLHAQVYNRLRRDWASLNTTTTMTESDFEKLCRTHLLILVDIPSPSRKVGFGRPLGVVPELKEKTYYQATRQAAEDKSWREIMDDMIRGIAPVRILCHPDVRNLVSAIYEKPSVEASMAKMLRHHLGLGE